MSRKITIIVGPREDSPQGHETIRYVMEQARDGDDVTIVDASAALHGVIRGEDAAPTPTQCNDEAAQKIGDAAEATLEARNDQQDREPAASDAAERAKRIVQSQEQLKEARKELNKAGIKWGVDGILTEGWKKILEAVEFVRDNLPW
jgi:uncharacterized protein (DUF849 family)